MGLSAEMGPPGFEKRLEGKRSPVFVFKRNVEQGDESFGEGLNMQRQKGKGEKHPACSRDGFDRQHIVCAVFLVLCSIAIVCCGASATWGAARQAGKQNPLIDKRVRHDLLSVSFPTEKEGWVCGRWGTIMHSSDGGASWERQVSGVDFTLTSISFVDSKAGWVAGDNGTILHTTNGGKTWEKQKTPVQLYLMAIQFVDAHKGWAVGERTTILHTTDGGRTWQVQFKDEDFILKGLSFCDERNGWAVGEYGLIYHTENGGLTWKKQAGGFGISEETGELEAGNILFRVTALNPKTALAVGIDGFVTKTTDGGATWQVMGKNVPKVHLFGVASSGDKVVIGGTGILLVGSLNGSKYEVADVTPKATYGYLYAVAPRGKAGFVAVGKAGWIYITDEKAQRWRLAEKR